jgi:hypothetical protein
MILSPTLSQIPSPNLLSLTLSIHVNSVKNDAFKVVLVGLDIDHEVIEEDMEQGFCVPDLPIQKPYCLLIDLKGDVKVIGKNLFS